MRPAHQPSATQRVVAQESAGKDLLRFSAIGSVDDGKSTLIGRLLHDTQSIYEDQLSTLKADSARVGTGPEIDFALLTDGLKAEREQGITIDVAYRYFSTPKRHFIIADTPGHEQYTRNMVTGASTANLAIILIDARHGLLPQTKRHSFIASLLGIPRLLIAINKMDLIDFSQQVFDSIVAGYLEFATRLGVADLTFIPISALLGDNVVARSPRTPWYTRESVLEHLETVYIGSDRNLVDFRLPVQYVQRPDMHFRGFCGQIVSGVLNRGDEVMVLPTRKTSRVKSIIELLQGATAELEYAFTPMSVTLTLEDEIDVSRGDMLVHPRNLPLVQSTFEAMLVWMSDETMDLGLTYVLKHTTRSVKATVQRIEYRVDINTLSRAPAQALRLNEIGRVMLRTQQKLFIDAYKKNRFTGSFILVHPHTHHTVAAGMVIDRLPENQIREPIGAGSPRSENIRREEGRIATGERERLLGQRPLTLWFTGLSGSGKSSIAREIERRLHQSGRHVCVLDGDNLRFGLNRDLSFSKEDRSENIRRIAEVARLFNDAGTIVLVPVISPFREDRELARQTIGAGRFFEIFLNTPLEVCEARDSKGLYRKARAGEIEDFTGISSPYEQPRSPALTLDTSRRSVDECAEKILAEVEPRIRLP
jgi:bifunctional enzyme CysN/CysC